MFNEKLLHVEPCLKIMIADDHQMVVGALSNFLSSAGAFDIVPAHSLGDVMDALKATSDLDIILLDLNMPGMEGLASIKEVLKYAGDTKVVIFSAYADALLIDQVLKIGIKGFIPKSLPSKTLPSILRLVDSGQTFFPFRPTEANPFGKKKEKLTEAEILIIRLIGDGSTNKDIANNLGQTETTVKMIMRSICKKLGAKNRAHAAILGRELTQKYY